MRLGVVQSRERDTSTLLSSPSARDPVVRPLSHPHGHGLALLSRRQPLPLSAEGETNRYHIKRKAAYIGTQTHTQWNADALSLSGLGHSALGVFHARVCVRCYRA